MTHSRRQFFKHTAAAACAVGASALVLPRSSARAHAVDGPAEADLLDATAFRVRPEEVAPLVARLEQRTGASVLCRLDELILQTTTGPRCVRLHLIL